MIVAFQSRVSCPSCGHKVRYILIATVRVNKRSLRTVDDRDRIGALEHHLCPGCQQEMPADRPLDREPYTLVPADAEKVAAYRLRRWGIESGADVERVAG